MQCSERNGNLVTALQLFDGDEMMLISDKGTLVRTRVSEVSISSRNTQGVTLIRTGDDERLVKTVRVDEPSEEELAEDEVAVDLAEETPPADADAAEPGDERE